jgi:hypothetical protein
MRWQCGATAVSPMRLLDADAVGPQLQQPRSLVHRIAAHGVWVLSAGMLRLLEKHCTEEEASA